MKKINRKFVYSFIIMSFALILTNACKKDDNKVVYNRGSFTDPRDSIVYQTVTIGTQVWMAENLRYLPSVVGPYTGSDTIPYYYVYDYNGINVSEAKAKANYTIYGVLYNWVAAKIACPSGWHLPSDLEWKQLINYLNGENVAGGKLKETGITHWISPNIDATNETGFAALPGGYQYSNGSFLNRGFKGYWWSSTESNTTDAWYRGMDYFFGSVDRKSFGKIAGFSVRCVKD